jgi:hypothetical protein
MKSNSIKEINQIEINQVGGGLTVKEIGAKVGEYVKYIDRLNEIVLEEVVAYATGILLMQNIMAILFICLKRNGYIVRPN